MIARAIGGKDGFRLKSFLSQSGISTAAKNFVRNEEQSKRIFADYCIFKGKAALSISPRLPTFRKLDTGNLQLDRRGCMMLIFWPAIGERKYDWQKKQFFALSATEIGSLICLSPTDSCEFFHDPSMKSSNAGQVRKSLSIKPFSDGFFISLSVANNNLKTSERFTVPVTAAEFAVIRTASSFALPHLMGWNKYTDPSSPSLSMNPVKLASKVMGDEWER